MDTNSFAILMMGWQDKIPQDCVPALQDQLGKVPEDKIPVLSAVQLKNPIVGLLLGLFLGVFGIDRFYRGDIGLGITKLILTLTYFGVVITFVWSIVDLFLVWKGIKEDNWTKIQNVIYAL